MYRRPLATAASLLLLCAPGLWAQTVVGQVALNSARIDGALVPTGTAVLSPSLLETGEFPSTVHLENGQVVSLGAGSSARLEAYGDGGVQVTARSGQVRVGDGRGETFQLAANTVALLDQEEVIGESRRVVRIKMCRGPNDPVMVEPEEVDQRIEEGWGVAGVKPYDENCVKKSSLGLTPLGVGGLVAGTAGLFYLIGEDQSDTVQVQCQSPDASPIVPNVPICNAG